LLVDVPDETPALVAVGDFGLFDEALFEIGVAVAGVVALRATAVILKELLIRVVVLLRPIWSSLRASLGNQLAVSIGSSSPSIPISFS
jgi:hypothetical protein